MNKVAQNILVLECMEVPIDFDPTRNVRRRKGEEFFPDMRTKSGQAYANWLWYQNFKSTRLWIEGKEKKFRIEKFQYEQA